MIVFCLFQVVIMVLFFMALNNMINSAIDEAVGSVIFELQKHKEEIDEKLQKSGVPAEEHF